MNRVIPVLSKRVNLESFRSDSLSLTRAVDALRSIIMGASMKSARENATPNAARLISGFASRAMSAITVGNSSDIISHVDANGTQNFRILPCVRGASVSCKCFIGRDDTPASSCRAR